MEEENKRFMEWSSEELKEPCSQTEFCTADISYDLQAGIPNAGGEDGNVNDNDNDDNDLRIMMMMFWNVLWLANSHTWCRVNSSTTRSA